MRPPMAAPLAAVSSGVFAARFADFSTLDTIVFALCAAGLAAWGLCARRAWAGEAACLLGLSLAGAWLHDVRPAGKPCAVEGVLSRLEVDLAEPLRLRGWVSRPAAPRHDVDRFDLELEAILDGVPACGGVRLTVHREPEDPRLRIPFGTRVELLARLRRPDNFDNPGGFDYVGYLRERGIALTGTVRRYAPILPLEGASGTPWERALWAARIGLSDRFEELAREADLDKESAGLLRAILLGDQTDLSEGVRTAFERSGTYHALVVSGLHVGVAAAALFGLFRLIAAPRWCGGTAAAVFAGLYALLMEGATPVSRAAWMLAIYLAASAIFRRRRPVNVVCAAALGFLLWNPALLADVGSQLSFLSVGAISAIALPILERTTEQRRRALLDIWNVDLDLHLTVEQAERRVATRTWLEPLIAATRAPKGLATWCITGCLRSLWGAAALVVVSTVVAVALAAPLAWHFQRIAAAGPVVNVVAVPLVGVAVPVGLVGLLVGRPEALTVASWAAEGMRVAAEWGAAGSMGEWRVPPPPGWLAALAGLSMLGWAAGIARGGRAERAGLAAAVVAFAAIAIHPFPAAVERGTLELTAIDVGQGDALLLGLPDGEVALVDAGGIADFRRSVSVFDIGEDVVSPYLWSRSIRRLRALILTHPDADHIAGARAILRNFGIDELWLGRGTVSPDYEELTAEAERRGARVVWMEAGDARTLNGVVLEALSPEPEAALGRNDLSLALLARYGSHEFLLTGDLEAAGEALLAARLGEIDGEVLKVAHHGGRTSTVQDLLEKFRPKLAVISAGVDNLYGHPHRETLERLREAGVRVLRTDRDGLVTIVTDGERLEVR